jgi:hypothetical protein
LRSSAVQRAAQQGRHHAGPFDLGVQILRFGPQALTQTAAQTVLQTDAHTTPREQAFEPS